MLTQSEIMKRRWQDPVFRARMLKYLRSKVRRALMSAAAKKSWQNKEYRTMVIEKISKPRGPRGPLSEEQRKELSRKKRAWWKNNRHRTKQIMSKAWRANWAARKQRKQEEAHMR